jgi:hypothetical protein
LLCGAANRAEGEQGAPKRRPVLQVERALLDLAQVRDERRQLGLAGCRSVALGFRRGLLGLGARLFRLGLGLRDFRFVLAGLELRRKCCRNGRYA